MKEDFLHYVWQYKKFDFSNLTTAAGEHLTIVSVGNYLKQSGPDFFNAQIIIGSQKWAGNVEIHVKSSDWYLHHHERDKQYDNVVLHVVWEHDTPVFRNDNSELPVLELKKYVSKAVTDSYATLVSPKSWIYCENKIKTIEYFVFAHWMESLFFERLERKYIPINDLLEETGNDWEAVLFWMIAKNFGLNANGEILFKVVKMIPFAVIQKERFEVENLEALLFGLADLFPLEAEDRYVLDLKKRFNYLVQKHQLQKMPIEPLAFFKHRPDNFPTVRIAQLAMLYHQQQNLFSKIISAKTVNECYQVFNVSVSNYWQTHYLFDKTSSKKKKQLSKPFIDLLIINTIVPFQFAYQKSPGKEMSEVILALMQSIIPEKNSIIEKFANFGVKAQNAFETQSLLQLKNEYCNNSRCLKCSLGIQLLKS